MQLSHDENVPWTLARSRCCMYNEGIVALCALDHRDREWVVFVSLPCAVVRYSRSEWIGRGLVEDW